MGEGVELCPITGGKYPAFPPNLEGDSKSLDFGLIPVKTQKVYDLSPEFESRQSGFNSIWNYGAKRHPKQRLRRLSTNG